MVLCPSNKDVLILNIKNRYQTALTPSSNGNFDTKSLSNSIKIKSKYVSKMLYMFLKLKTYQKALTKMTKKQTVNTRRRSNYCLIQRIKKHRSNCSKTNTDKIHNQHTKMPLFCFKWNCYKNLAVWRKRNQRSHFNKLFDASGDGLKFKNSENFYLKINVDLPVK